MSRRLLSVLLLAAVAMTAVQAATMAQAKRWAATDPNGEGSAVIAWGDSKDEAHRRAVDACKRGSKTCANGPASTDTLSDVFAVMCCTKPRAGCAVGVGADRKKAAESVKGTLSGAGYGNCGLRHYISASSGKRL